MVYCKQKCRLCGGINTYIHQHEEANVVEFAEIKLWYFDRLVEEYYCEDCGVDALHDLCSVGQKEES